MKRPFYLSFPTQTVLFLEEDLPKSKGVVNFSHRVRENHLKKHHPELLAEYEEHCKNFSEIFDQIEKKIKR